MKSYKSSDPSFASLHNPSQKYAIVVMAVGRKYLRLFHEVRPQFDHYANSCHADLIVITNPPDPGYKRNLITQKMLIPDICYMYDWIAFIDLDVIISHSAPDIFGQIMPDKGFGAVVDPRNSAGFQQVVMKYWKMPQILQETHRSYFTSRGFADHPGLSASTNGGVWLCRPSKMAQQLKELYYSDFSETPGKESHEEGMMAYTSQTNNLFFSLDEAFNTQVLFQIYENSDDSGQLITKNHLFRFASLWERKTGHAFPWYTQRYMALIRKLKKSRHILHFSGGLPFLKLLKQWR